MSERQIATIRAFNRLLTRRIGVLDESFLGRGRPLAQARLMYEIGPEGMDLRSLRQRMGLDSGYLSRMLRVLELERLLETGCDRRDARRRLVRLSRKGCDELARYDRLSDAFARQVLKPLHPKQRESLVDAMAEVSRLLRIGSLEIRVEDPASPGAKWCLEQYYRELGHRFDAGFDPARSISASPGELRPPRGVFVVASSLAEPIGCGALKVKTGGVGEVKRMWVDRAARGIGVGRRILDALERFARRRGLRTLRLETNRSLEEAQRLYRSAGFAEVAPFNDEPYAHHWFEKCLTRSSGRGR